MPFERNFEKRYQLSSVLVLINNHQRVFEINQNDYPCFQEGGNIS
jgi:hypothetical protein